MKLRKLVPALGLATLTATSAMAEDKAPMVSFAGWVDAIVAYSDDDTDDNAATAKDEAAGSLYFSSVASLNAMWNVTDALSAKVNLWFDSETADVWMREAYFAWALNDNLTWSMGKYIDHIGWIAAEPTGLYTVNDSLIGYTDAYGNDVLGTSLSFAPKDSPVSGSVHVTNGYFTGDAAFNDYQGGNKPNRENTDLGFGVDLTYMFPDNKGNLNFDFAYDMHSDISAGNAAPLTGNDMGGDVLLVGLNATITAVKNLTIGAEVIYMTLDDGEDGTGATLLTGADRLQFMGLVNYVLEGTPVPMSVSGMVQVVSIDYNSPASPETEDRLGAAVALLTNPLTSTNFGLNFEVGFFDITGEDGTPGAAGENNGVVVSVEGLVTF